MNAALAAALYATVPAAARKLGLPNAVGLAAVWFGALVPSAWPDIDRHRTGGAWDLYHPSANVPAAEQLRGEGEVAYNRRLLNDAMVWVQQHPTRAATLVAQRTASFWVPFTQRPLQRVFRSGLSRYGLWGLFLMFRQGEPQRRSTVMLLALRTRAVAGSRNWCARAELNCRPPA